MKQTKPTGREERQLRRVRAHVAWDENGHFVPTQVHYPLYKLEDENNPEVPHDYEAYDVTLVDEEDAANPDLGVNGRKYTIDVIANSNRTVRTVIWFNDDCWLVEEKVKSK